MSDVDPRVFFEKATLLYKMGIALMDIYEKKAPAAVVTMHVEQVEACIEEFRNELKAAGFNPDEPTNAILTTLADVEELCRQMRGTLYEDEQFGRDLDEVTPALN